MFTALPASPQCQSVLRMALPGVRGSTTGLLRALPQPGSPLGALGSHPDWPTGGCLARPQPAELWTNQLVSAGGGGWRPSGSQRIPWRPRPRGGGGGLGGHIEWRTAERGGNEARERERDRHMHTGSCAKACTCPGGECGHSSDVGHARADQGDATTRPGPALSQPCLPSATPTSLRAARLDRSQAAAHTSLCLCRAS